MIGDQPTITHRRNWICLPGTVIRGHRVASGLNGDPRFPGGTLAMQIPFFLQSGLDLGVYHQATINLSLSPYEFSVCKPLYTFPNLKWCPTEPAEDFSFFDCMIGASDDPADLVPGLIYYPHPETKPEHFHSPHVLEILTSRLSGVFYGVTLLLHIDPLQLHSFVR